MKVRPIYIFSFLCLAFLAYSFSIYFNENANSKNKSKFNIKLVKEIETKLSSKGKLIWQKYNCQSCHQIYSLGGYLGPDLTNLYSKYNKSEEVLKHFFKGGTKQMPIFKLNRDEEKSLLAFFKVLDNTGKSDPRTFKRLTNGMIEND